MSKRTRKPRSDAEKEAANVNIDFGIGGIFKGLGSFIELLGKMAEEGKSEFSRTGEVKGPGRTSAMYGFTVKIGAEGLPRVERFGNIRATDAGPVVQEEREPMVDVFDEGDQVLVIAEIPGVDASAIELEVKEDILVLSAGEGSRKYRKEVLLPCAVQAQTLKSSYRNGILEIRLAKAPAEGS
jgi:HSP20 family protein